MSQLLYKGGILMWPGFRGWQLSLLVCVLCCGMMHRVRLSHLWLLQVFWIPFRLLVVTVTGSVLQHLIITTVLLVVSLSGFLSIMFICLCLGNSN